MENKGIRHVNIKPRRPELNGRVERSHRSDQEEFYQLLTYKDEVDLNKKLEEWERFYNYDRPHGAFQGKTPYEVLRSLLRYVRMCLTRYDTLQPRSVVSVDVELGTPKAAFTVAKRGGHRLIHRALRIQGNT